MYIEEIVIFVTNKYNNNIVNDNIFSCSNLIILIVKIFINPYLSIKLRLIIKISSNPFLKNYILYNIIKIYTVPNILISIKKSLVLVIVWIMQIKTIFLNPNLIRISVITKLVIIKKEWDIFLDK